MWYAGSPEDFVNPFAGDTYYALQLKDGKHVRYALAKYTTRETRNGGQVACLMDLNTREEVMSEVIAHTRIESTLKIPG